MTIEDLIAEYASIYRNRIARGDIAAPSVDTAVAYACQDVLNMARQCGDPLGVLADEVAYARECFEKLGS